MNNFVTLVLIAMLGFAVFGLTGTILHGTKAEAQIKVLTDHRGIQVGWMDENKCVAVRNRTSP